MIARTLTPARVDQLLDARVAQTTAALNAQFLNFDPENRVEDLEKVFRIELELQKDNFARNQNFIIQHHLAKTILSTT